MDSAPWRGSLAAIFTAPDKGAPVQAQPAARAEPGRGLEGDRYWAGRGAFSRWPGPRREVTLIAAEALAEAEAAFGVALSAGQHRRNLVVAGVLLEELVRAPFRIGSVRLEGVQVCAPCRYLVRVTGQERIFDALVGRGGLRARILEGGTLRVGDPVVPDGPAAPGPP